MLAFIDESGDPGMKNIGQSSSRYFAVTLVLFEETEEALAADQRIELLKRELGFGPQFEFHFTKLKPIYRKAFLEAVAPYSFFYFSIVVNKAKLFGPGFKFPDPFYKYTCGLVFENTKPYLSNTIVVIDGSGDRKFRQQLQGYLKKRINEDGDGKQYIKKVKMPRSIERSFRIGRYFFSFGLNRATPTLSLSGKRTVRSRFESRSFPLIRLHQ